MHQGVEDYNVQTSRNIGVFCIHSLRESLPVTADAETTAPCDDSHVVVVICLSSLIIIIMYVYHALINALSAHMIHINLNVIFFMHR